jgi:hypothetical protein
MYFAIVIYCFTSTQGVMSIKVTHDNERGR